MSHCEGSKLMKKNQIAAFKLLKDWLKVEGNTKARLAKFFGYASHSVISNWFKRKKIPNYIVNRITKEGVLKNVNA